MDQEARRWVISRRRASREGRPRCRKQPPPRVLRPDPHSINTATQHRPHPAASLLQRQVPQPRQPNQQPAASQTSHQEGTIKTSNKPTHRHFSLQLRDPARGAQLLHLPLQQPDLLVQLLGQAGLQRQLLLELQGSSTMYTHAFCTCMRNVHPGMWGARACEGMNEVHLSCSSNASPCACVG